MTSSGEERFDIIFPKYKKGGHIVRKVSVNPTYSKYNYYDMLILSSRGVSIVYSYNCPFLEYVEMLMTETMRRCSGGIIEELPSDNIPAPLSTQYERPEKSSAIKSHKSRFNL